MDLKLNMRSRILIQWTTNPANFGYDGEKSAWTKERPMSIKKAKAFRSEIAKKIGSGTYFALQYYRNGGEISLREIEDVIDQHEATNQKGA